MRIAFVGMPVISWAGAYESTSRETGSKSIFRWTFLVCLAWFGELLRIASICVCGWVGAGLWVCGCDGVSVEKVAVRRMIERNNPLARVKL